MQQTLWRDSNVSAPSAGLFARSRHLQWVGLQMTAVLPLAVAGGGCHDTVDAAQNQLHGITRHRNLDSPHHPSLLLIIFFLLCLSSSHHHCHLPFSLLSILLPPPLLALPVPPQTDKEGKSSSGSSGRSGRTGRCAEACNPPYPPLPCSTGKALCSPLISVKDYVFVKSV